MYPQAALLAPWRRPQPHQYLCEWPPPPSPPRNQHRTLVRGPIPQNPPRTRPARTRPTFSETKPPPQPPSTSPPLDWTRRFLAAPAVGPFLALLLTMAFF